MFKILREKLGNSTIYVEFALIVLMFLLSFITFKNIFSQTKGGDYFQEVIAALIGTLLTIIITFILLKQQTKTEELKEQNVEVFKKRIARYEEMIQLLVDVREDGKVDKKEAQLLLKAIYNLALVSSEDTIFTLSEYVQNLVFKDEAEDNVSLVGVITCFRKELKLEGLDEFSVDLEAVETLLASGFDRTEYDQVKEYLLESRDQIITAFEKRLSSAELDLYDFERVNRSGKSMMLIALSKKTEMAYQVILEHGPEDTENLRFRMVVNAEIKEDGEHKKFPKAKIQLWENHATSRGFEVDDYDGNWGMAKIYSSENSRSRLSVRAILGKLTPQITQDILFMEGFGPEEPNTP